MTRVEADRRRRRWPSWGVETVLDLLTTYPRRYIDRTPPGRRGRPGRSATRRWSWPRCARSDAARDPPGPGPGRARRATTAPAGMHGHLLQPALAGQAAPGRDRRPSSSASSTPTGAAQMANPVVDLVAGDGLGADRPDRARSTRRRRRPGSPAGRSAAGWTRRSTGPARSPTRCPTRWRRELDLVDRTAAFRGIHLPESMDETRTGPPPPGLRRAVPAAARRWCCGAGPPSATPGPSATRVALEVARPAPPDPWCAAESLERRPGLSALELTRPSDGPWP